MLETEVTTSEAKRLIRVSLGNGSWIVLKDGGDNLFVGNETKMVISGFMGYNNDVHRMSPYWV